MVRDHQEYVHRMDEAYVKDLEAFSNGEVVDNRLKMIKDVDGFRSLVAFYSHPHS